MKKIILTAVVAMGVAAPAFAQTQLEAAVGAASGQYTVGELAQLKAASTLEGGEGRVYLGNRKIQFSASNIHNTVADRIFADLAAASKEDE